MFKNNMLSSFNSQARSQSREIPKSVMKDIRLDLIAEEKPDADSSHSNDTELKLKLHTGIISVRVCLTDEEKSRLRKE
jgi:hypothetical protein